MDELIKKRRDLDPVAPLPVNLITKWTRQLLEALEYMHSFKPKPIVHRDIKSRNVFLKNNQIKLGDMGVSRVLAETFAGYSKSFERIQVSGFNRIPNFELIPFSEHHFT